jgi:hypothetical protein
MRIKGRAERDEEREGFSPWQAKKQQYFSGNGYDRACFEALERGFGLIVGWEG